VELSQEEISGREARLLNLDADGVKEARSISCKLNSVVVKLFHEQLGHESAFDSHLLETSWSVPLHVEGGHVRKQGLGGTDVAGGLISSDVLLSCLHRHSEGLVAVYILGDTNDTAWHFSFVFIHASEVAWMWTSVSEWNTHSLGGSDGNIGTHSSWRLDKIEGQNVRNNREYHATFLEKMREVGVVADITEVVWVLHDHTAILLGVGPWELFDLSDVEVDTDSMALGPDDINGLWEQSFTAEDFLPFALVDVVGHLYGLGGTGGLIEEGGVGDVHTSQLHDGGLVIKKRLQTALSDLWLIWSIWGVPAWIF